MRKLWVVLVGLLCLGGCPLLQDDNTGTASVDVSGTWRSLVNFQTCSPQTTCDDAGFTPGTSATATMALTQDGSRVRGTYTYDGSGVQANVSGEVAGDQLALNGEASNPLGKITVRLTGTVSDRINGSLSHEVRLSDGRSASVTGTGNFTK